MDVLQSETGGTTSVSQYKQNKYTSFAAENAEKVTV